MCRATGNPVPTITWSMNENRLPLNSSNMSTSTVGQQITSVFHINNLDRYDAGNYTCRATNVLAQQAVTSSNIVDVSVLCKSLIIGHAFVLL